MKKEIFAMLAAGMLTCVPCFAAWMHAERVDVNEMQKYLTRYDGRDVYVHEEGSKWAYLYENIRDDYDDLALEIAKDLNPEQMTYIYTNNKKVYKNLAEELEDFKDHRTFNGYRLMTDKDGSRELRGTDVYRIWALKVDQPTRIIRHDSGLNPAAVILDILGLPIYHHERDRVAPPPKHRVAPPPPKPAPAPQKKVVVPAKPKPAPAPQKKVVVPAKPKPAPASQKKVVVPAKPRQEMKKTSVMPQKHEMKKPESKKQHENRPEDKTRNPMSKGKEGKGRK